MPLSTTNSVLAKAMGGEVYDDAEALVDVKPGQGVVRGDGGVEAAGADDATKIVAREQRNPGGIGIDDDTSPLDHTYDAGSNVELIFAQSHTQLRLLVDDDGTETTVTEGDELAWGSDGYLVTDGSETVATAVNESPVTIGANDGPTHIAVELK